MPHILPMKDCLRPSEFRLLMETSRTLYVVGWISEVKDIRRQMLLLTVQLSGLLVWLRTLRG